MKWKVDLEDGFCPVYELEPGDCFVFPDGPGTPYMVLVYTGPTDQPSRPIRAANLATGDVEIFQRTCAVIKRDATVVLSKITRAQ